MSKAKKRMMVAVYADIYELISQTEMYHEHGLTYAVNYELAERFGITRPPTPNQKKSRGGRSATGSSKNHHRLSLPTDWLRLLEEIAVPDKDSEKVPWQKQDFGSLAILAERAKLVRFVKNRGAVATKKLKDVWNAEEDPKKVLTGIWNQTATKFGYQIKISEDD